MEDASTDGSKEILLDYVKQDNRIKIHINEKNCGAACSRNQGLKLAKGEYIFFVDADDVFEDNLLEEMAKLAIQQTPDLVYINHDIFWKDQLDCSDKRHRYYFFSEVLNSKLALCNDDRKAFIDDMQLAPYSKLYRSEFIKKNALEFQNLKSSNDVYFGIMAAFLSEKNRHTGKYENLVHVRQHNSKYRISNNRNPFDNFQAYEYIKQEMQKRNMWEIYGAIVQEKFLSNVIYEISVCDKALSKQYYYFLKTKGLSEMMLWNPLFYRKLRAVYRKMLYFFQTEEFESEWYKNIDWFSSIIDENEEKILTLFQVLEDSKQEYAIWGAGHNGELMSIFCSEHHCQCKCLIDNDKKKTGDMMNGYKVYSPETGLRAVSTVIITNQTYFNDIYEQIKQMNKKVVLISLELYLKYHISIRESSVAVDI